MHLPDINQYSNEDLLKNVEVSNKFKFIGKKISERLDGYDKSDIKFERFQNGVHLAIEQSNNYETNIDNIFTNLGTNLGKLLSEILM